MKKTAVLAMCVLVIMLGLVGLAQANLTVIGTATYLGSNYNLVWEDNNNGNSLVWLDYTAPAAYWGSQMSWATGLDSQLTYNIDPAYSVTWIDSAWRLPTAGNAPATGFGPATQEMGYLYYTELGFAGGLTPPTSAPDLAGSIFDNLSLMEYWTSTPDVPYFGTNTSWMFSFFGTDNLQNPCYGYQDIDWSGTNWLSSMHAGLAVRSADVSAGVVPIPPSMLLLGTGLLSLAGFKARQRISG